MTVAVLASKLLDREPQLLSIDKAVIDVTLLRKWLQAIRPDKQPRPSCAFLVRGALKFWSHTDFRAGDILERAQTSTCLFL